MKANEAPDKVYVVDVTFPDYVDFDGSPINTKRIDDHDIEYTRTDAFIEKATRWLLTNASDYVALHNGYDTKMLVKDFVDAMKGE